MSACGAKQTSKSYRRKSAIGLHFACNALIANGTKLPQFALK